MSMILHAKPIAYGMGDRCYMDWKVRGSDIVRPPEEPKEKEEKEFFSEEEFKV